MDRLSFELVELIASYLDAGDALALSMVCSSVRAGCISRLAPERYLQQTFRHPRRLLAAMTDHGCILSGSRALEYFVPGSIAREGAAASDWDFLVPCNRSSVFGMMDALAASGVMWESSLEDVLALVDKPVGSEALIRTRTVVIATMLDGPAADMLAVQGLADMLAVQGLPARTLYMRLLDFALTNAEDEQRSWLGVEVVPASLHTREQSPDTVTELKIYEVPQESLLRAGAHADALLAAFQYPGLASADGTDDDDAFSFGSYVGGYGYPHTTGGGGASNGHPICLINGYIKLPRHSGSATTIDSAAPEFCKVQLFQCHQREGYASTPLEYVVNTYYASHVQCFIAGWAAGHFYYDLVHQHLAVTWPTLSARQESAVAKCVRKYRRRGYRFFSSASENIELNDDFLPVDHMDLPAAVEKPKPEEVKPTNPEKKENPVGGRRHDDDGSPRHASRADNNAYLGAVNDIIRDIQELHVKPDTNDELPLPAPVARVRPAAPLFSLPPLIFQPRPPTPPPPFVRLPDTAYAALRQACDPVASRHLGGPGTLVLRFRSTHRLVRAAARVADTQAARRKADAIAFYRQLLTSLRGLRVIMDAERPMAIEMVMPNMRRWGPLETPRDRATSAPSLSLLLAGLEGEANAASGRGGSSSNSNDNRSSTLVSKDPAQRERRHRHYAILMQYALACADTSCRDAVARYLPPQI